ncbi:GNAT family N-acetyltransferase [Micromonospora sp. NPDC005305]|uniref:GNAT family N-acetyltransferase n=1 Tax=Micromonospora sp. NPDC005305 TaxID=3156875 RepID=UPI0033AA6849
MVLPMLPALGVWAVPAEAVSAAGGAAGGGWDGGGAGAGGLGLLVSCWTALIMAGAAPMTAGMIAVSAGAIWASSMPDPPDHQILRPESSAQVHTVVAGDAPDQGVGAALLDAAEKWAVTHGIAYLSAGIHHRNVGAVRFYGRHWFADSGISLVRTLDRVTH